MPLGMNNRTQVTEWNGDDDMPDQVSWIVRY